MKFNLLSVFLLASTMLPLASSAPSRSNVTATILYSDRFIHTEGFDLHTFNYTFYTAGLTFVIERGLRLPRERLQVNHFGEKSEFAIEIFSDPKENYRHSNFCRLHSNSTMVRRFLRDCEGLIAMRSLTDEEYRKIKEKKYQLQRKHLKVVYNQKSLNITTSNRIGRLDFELSHRNPSDDHSRLMINAYTGIFVGYMEIRAKNDRFPNGTFVIEDSIDPFSSTDCSKTDLHDLKPWKCRGNIILREFDERKDAQVPYY